jgi:GPI-anchor transamidase subunit K
MHEKARYRRLLLFVETCEAETLTDRVYSPNVLTIATSKLGAPAHETAM